LNSNFDDSLGQRTPAELARLTAALQQQADAVQAAACVGCGAPLCGHEALLNVVLGSRLRARCLPCLGQQLGELPVALAERSLQWILRRECFLHVWHGAGEREQGRAADRPACLFLAGASPQSTSSQPSSLPQTSPEPTSQPPAAHQFRDFGDQGCGELVLELRNMLRGMAAGEVLHLIARDLAAPIDLPAWCGLTGHSLLHTSHPEYWIQRRNRP
jgi:tRNA 2-thiouridine synthesizing protein A